MGVFLLSMSSLKLQYFPLRGRGEVIRLALAYKGIEYVEEPIDYQAMKSAAGSAEHPFGQAPIFVVGDLHIAQMDSILRYLAREYDLYGSNNTEKALIDMVLGGVESIRGDYTNLIYKDELKDDAKKSYAEQHFGTASITTRNGGAHFQYLENFLQRNGGGKGWAVGDVFSIADIHLFDIIDLHLRDQLFPSEVKEKFPLLVAHHGRVAAEANIAAYLASDKRPSHINGCWKRIIFFERIDW